MVLQEYLVKRIGERLQRLLAHLWFQFTFPNRDAMPPHRGKFLLHPQVALLVSPDLGHPELPIRLRNLTALGIIKFFAPLAFWRGVGGEAHIVTMPEAPIHKDTRPVLPHHDVWLSRQPRMVQPVAESLSPQPFPDHHLRLRVLAVDGRHIRMPLLLREWVHDQFLLSFNSQLSTINSQLSPLRHKFTHLF